MSRTCYRIVIAAYALLGMSLAAGPGAFATAPDILWEQVDAHSAAEAITYSTDGEIVASGGGGQDAVVKFWRASDGEPLWIMDVVGDNTTGIRSVDFSPDGELLTIGTLVSGYPPGGRAELRRVEDFTLLFYLGGCFADISPTGEHVAGGGGGVNRYVEVCTIPSGTTVTYFSHGSYIGDLAWSPDGVRVASCGSNNEVRLWNVETEALERTFAPHTDDVSSIAFSPDGTLLAAGEGGWDEPGGSAIRIWRVADGELLRTLEGHGSWVYDVAFSPSGRTLISSGRDAAGGITSIRIWRVADGELLEVYDEEVSGGVLSILFAPGPGAFAYGRGDGDVLVAAYEEESASIQETALATRSAVLQPPVPNPLRAASEIPFSLHRGGSVSLTVHDARGRRVAELVQEILGIGLHRAQWDGRNSNGHRVSPGVYFIRLAAQGEKGIRPIVVVR